MTEIHNYLKVDKFNFLEASDKDVVWVDRASETNQGFLNQDPHTSIQIFPEPTKVGDIEFKPVASPEALIKSGIFGGLYFGSGKPDRAKNAYKIFKELPPEWFKNVYMSSTKARWRENKFGTNAGLDANWWHERKLIDNIDPLGWVNWYCKYWLGRRIPSIDRRQISRWYSYQLRHSQMALSNPNGVSDRYRQSLWQWAVNPYPDIVEV